MAQNNFETAESHLQEALGKDSANADALANMITVSYHMSKSPEVIARLVRYGHFDSEMFSYCFCCLIVL